MTTETPAQIQARLDKTMREVFPERFERTRYESFTGELASGDAIEYLAKLGSMAVHLARD